MGKRRWRDRIPLGRVSYAFIGAFLLITLPIVAVMTELMIDDNFSRDICTDMEAWFVVDAGYDCLIDLRSVARQFGVNMLIAGTVIGLPAGAFAAFFAFVTRDTWQRRKAAREAPFIS